jgi:hypothetical protein
MKKLLKHFRMWRLKRKLWRAAGSLMACGQHNGPAQNHINNAKDSLYAAVRWIDRDLAP